VGNRTGVTEQAESLGDVFIVNSYTGKKTHYAKLSWKGAPRSNTPVPIDPFRLYVSNVFSAVVLSGCFAGIWRRYFCVGPFSKG
jgi:hypothetical protein